VINSILIIIGMMVYMFVGALIGFFIDDRDIAWAAFMAVLWPAFIILMAPIRFADYVYTKIRMWRLTHR
jgi:hypothetical protein